MYVGNSNLPHTALSSATRKAKDALSPTPTKNVSDVSASTSMSAMKNQMKAFSVQFKQTVAEAEKSATDSSSWRLDTTTKLERINVYTKEDALRRAWDAQQPTVRIDLSGKDGAQGVEGWNPSALQSAETLRDFESRLQADGLSVKPDEKYWSNLVSDLRNVKYGSATSTVTATGEDFRRRVDYLASRAVAAETLINNNTDGKERKEQLTKLYETISDTAKTIANSYAEITSAFLRQNGVSDERDKIYDSVIRGIESMTDAYRAALSDNKELSALSDTPDKWLLQDDAYVASMLRKTADTSAFAQRSDAVYTINDLTTLGQLTSELASMERFSDLYSMDEERMGLEFAMLSMKTDTLQESGSISNNMAEMIQRATSGYMDAFLNRMDARLQKARNTSETASDEKGFAALEKSAVWNVYTRTMQDYQAGGNVMRAFQEGAMFSYEQRNQNVARMDGVYRYTNSASYWNNFFQMSAKKEGAYQTNSVTFNNYVAGWDDFERSLHSKDAIRFNLLLRSMDNYSSNNRIGIRA